MSRIRRPAWVTTANVVLGLFLLCLLLLPVVLLGTLGRMDKSQMELQAREISTLVTDIRRGFHTLKGSGRMVGANEVGDFAWHIETVLNAMLEGSIAAGDDVMLSVR